MSDPLYWKLCYANGRTLTEQEVGALRPGQHASIKETPRGATEMQLLSPQGTMRFRLDLRNGYRPVFYRNRHLDMTFSLNGPQLSKTMLSATVFGRVYQVGVIQSLDEGSIPQMQYDGQLWAFLHGQLVNCPPSLVNLTEIDAQVS